VTCAAAPAAEGPRKATRRLRIRALRALALFAAGHGDVQPRHFTHRPTLADLTPGDTSKRSDT